MQGPALDGLWMAPGERRRSPTAVAAAKEDAAYDLLRMGATVGVRAHAADRELTKDEVEAREQAAAEAARAGGEEAAVPAGGYAARRARAELKVRVSPWLTERHCGRLRPHWVALKKPRRCRVVVCVRGGGVCVEGALVGCLWVLVLAGVLCRHLICCEALWG